MKIRYLSDLHLELHPPPDDLQAGDEDLIILAGNIAEGLDGITWAQRTFPPPPSSMSWVTRSFTVRTSMG